LAERSVTFIMVEIWEGTLKLARRSVRTAYLRQLKAGAAVQLRRPTDVIANKQIKIAVVIVINPGSAGAPTVAPSTNSGHGGHVMKFAIALIVKEVVAVKAGDENVLKPVVIIVTNGHAHTKKADVQAGVRCNIGKMAVAVIAVQRH